MQRARSAPNAEWKSSAVGGVGVVVWLHEAEAVLTVWVCRRREVAAMGGGGGGRQYRGAEVREGASDRQTGSHRDSGSVLLRAGTVSIRLRQHI